MRNILAVCAFSALVVPQLGLADIAVTYGSPSAQFTTVAGTSQYTFDNMTPGLYTNVNWAGVGTFDQYYVEATNIFGGSNNTSYAVTGTPSSILESTLTFNAPESYFGFEWLAVDGENSFTATFYSGTTQVGTFNSNTLISALGTCSAPASAYCGNANNRSLDPGELFGYVNFTGTQGTTISKVTFSNANASTGFEYDSLAVLAGTPTPEPAMFGCLLSGLGALVLAVRKRRV